MHRIKILYLFSFVLACVFLSACVGKDQQPGSPASGTENAVNIDSVNHVREKETQTESVSSKNGDYEIKVFKNESPLTGFGYDILNHGKVYIHQPNIPAVQGNQGFASEDDATKTARLVLHKIKNNIMPPGIDEHELDSIGVIRK